MENDKFYHPIWNSSNFGIEIQTNELNCSSEQLQNCFFNPNWETQMDQNDPFESALSSMVSSPVASSHNGDATQIRELIGKLGTICNSREISPPFFGGNNSTNTSCYSTPLNSPPKLNLSMMDHHITGNSRILGNGNPSLAALSADPGFAERAAKFSCFGSRSLGQFGSNETELPYRSTPDKLSRASSSHSLKVNVAQMGVHESKDTEFTDSHENSSVTEQIPGGEIGLKGHNDVNARKRKSIPRGKGKEKEKDIDSSPSAKDAKVAQENDESNAKRSKSNDESSKQTKDNSKPPEPPKDYIHVRARRGQATDSHSLAERVRREKISERMKFLQDLVPGCNKVTGKAVMLDEIINYVQSLQRQVEFLSMKLATVNPRMDFNVEALLSKEMFQARAHSMYSMNSSASAFSYGSSSIPNEAQLAMNPLSLTMRRNQSLQLPNIDGFVEAASLIPTLWGGDLQSVVEMGFGQNQTQTFQSSIATSNMKIEQ